MMPIASIKDKCLNLSIFFFSSRRRHTSWTGDWSSDVCSSDLPACRARAAAPDVPGDAVAQRPGEAAVPVHQQLVELGAGHPSGAGDERGPQEALELAAGAGGEDRKSVV